MKNTDRYTTSHLPEDQYEPGSALQAGLPPLDFSELQGGKRDEYFAAVQAGMNRDYKPMEWIFRGVIERTLSACEG